MVFLSSLLQHVVAFPNALFPSISTFVLLLEPRQFNNVDSYRPELAPLKLRQGIY